MTNLNEISDVSKSIGKFNDLDINEELKAALAKMEMVNMTPIQAKCIPQLLKGKDIMGAAKTGSGKTLAFLVPLVNKLINDNMSFNHGTMAIVLSPTRELSQQIYEVLVKLTSGTNIKSELIVGGKNRMIEAKSLSHGVTVVVATPGRLKDHLNNTEHFLVHRLHTLIIDEADRLMDQGFFEDMSAIIKKLPKLRQTILFSATLKINCDKLKSKMKEKSNGILQKKSSTEERVLTLACLSLKKNCVYVDISTEDLPSEDKTDKGHTWTSTVSQLTENYVVLEPQDKFLYLYAIIQKYKNKKVIIFMSTNLEVKYYSELLDNISVSVIPFYGKLKQTERELNYTKFRDNESGVILCTDVAARGLDVPDVDMVVQFDPPKDYKDHLHRVGRTARAGHYGQAILMLRPHEVGYLSIMVRRKIPMTEIEFLQKPPIQQMLEDFVHKNAMLKLSGEAAFISLMKAYNTNTLPCFNFNDLDVNAMAKSFGLSEPPQVMINASMKTKKRSRPKDQHHMTMKRPKIE